ncbi:MAG: hypothetical protein AAGU12_11925 [Clostridiales bacterium]
MKTQKRVFGWAEAIFDILYLLTAAFIGLWLLQAKGSAIQTSAGAAALLLATGDAFHLLPRISAILTRREQALAKAMGFGKLVTSITMTFFYLLLWQLGLELFSPNLQPGWSLLVYGLGALRILLCLFPQNRWLDRHPPLRWGIYRNIPFLLIGLGVAALFTAHRGSVPAADGMGPAILLSFAFYLPVVLWADKKPKLGMLMLPKTCAYLWMLFMFLSL